MDYMNKDDDDGSFLLTYAEKDYFFQLEILYYPKFYGKFKQIIFQQIFNYF